MSNWKKGIKVKSDHALTDIYKFYKATQPKPLNRSDYGKVVNLFNNRIIDKIYEGFVFKLPANIGMIGVRISRSEAAFDENGNLDMLKSTLSTDWGSTNKLWNAKPELKHKQYIFHENLHTNGKRFKIAWSRRYSGIPCLVNYRFFASRAFKRNLTKYIINNPNQEYYEF